MSASSFIPPLPLIPSLTATTTITTKRSPSAPSSLRNSTFTPSLHANQSTPSRSNILSATLKPPSSSPSTLSTSSKPPLHVRHWYRTLSSPSPTTLRAVNAVFASHSVTVQEEICFNVGLSSSQPLSPQAENTLRWLLAETFEPNRLTQVSTLPTSAIEVGPRLNFQTAWSSNAVSICSACGIPEILRLERSRRYLLSRSDGQPIPNEQIQAFANAVHDRMTECIYPAPLQTFESGLTPEKTYEIDVLKHGKKALQTINDHLGLGFDQQDIAYYEKMFLDMNRNPTNVELFDLAQSNSEHSRHWFFKGKLVIDGELVPNHLLDIVRDTLRANPTNSVIAFADNSSTIRGSVVPILLPSTPGVPGKLDVARRDLDVLFTAETHNFPSGVAPFPGAETGTGGRIRDTAATGTGSLVMAGTAGYSVGNLHIPGMQRAWEDETFAYPHNLASPLQILIQASNGASDYGNKFGEPVINGFARSYGLRLPSGERREFVKPIMFSGGMGQMDHNHSKKGEAEIGLLVVKVGGPAYRIGMGGGAASSMMQGENKSDLDFNAVQRGDAEMAQKVYRVLRACVEMGVHNPIVSIHDQGAGGNCNVVKELIYPAGARIDVRKVWVGDSSLSALEIWGAEYQEQFGLLLRPEHEGVFRGLCARENVVPVVLGSIDGSGRIVLWDDEEQTAVVDMDLEQVLGDLPQKTFTDFRKTFTGSPLKLPQGEDFASTLNRVLSLMTVGSKRFLTTKVDRSVTGLVAQQQCVGPLQLPLSDYAVTAQSHFTLRGSATSIGERPSLTSISPAAMARITVGEMLTNLAGVKLTHRKDIKCEGNWMWAAKLPGDCASLHDAAVAMRDVMIELGIAIDGGKDSLSMAAKCPVDSSTDSTETVRAPGTLVVSGYCTVPDIKRKVTPDIKEPGNSSLLLVDIACGKRRLGGSSITQVYGQVGDVAPDVDDPKVLLSAFDIVQDLVEQDELLACHDVSDGGLITTVLEMGFAGNCGLDISVSSKSLGTDVMATLFAEELGIVIEVREEAVERICKLFSQGGVPCDAVARTRKEFSVSIRDDEVVVYNGDIRDLRDNWEETSFGLERQQANERCVEQEQKSLRDRTGPKYKVWWEPHWTAEAKMVSRRKPKVAIVREEGSNGDREMSTAFYLAGFEPWDVSIRDISCGGVELTKFCGVVFVGGFSYADVLDSAKGWAGVVRFNERVRGEFEEFYAREDTFSLGVCNGCQLMALLGWVPFSPSEISDSSQPRFIGNESGRYESRFSSVRIEDESPAIMLKGMGGAQLGVWVAHGEGRAYFPDAGVLKTVEDRKLAAMKYMDDDGNISNSYPSNPNGSMAGIAGLCSRDGRHLAVMPHPERSVFKWQWGYMPREMAGGVDASPWLRMFQNAYDWVRNKA